MLKLWKNKEDKPRNYVVNCSNLLAQNIYHMSLYRNIDIKINNLRVTIQYYCLNCYSALVSSFVFHA